MDLSEFGDAAAFLRRNKDDPLLPSPAFDGKTWWKLLAWVHIITLSGITIYLIAMTHWFWRLTYLNGVQADATNLWTIEDIKCPSQ